MSELRGLPVLVTGASGFIGGQLAERLLREDGARVVGTGRRFLNETALQGEALVRADLRDAATRASLCAGKQIVFHLAAWAGQGSDTTEAHAVNVEATRALAEAAARAGVQRFILVSTAAAYGLPDTDDVDELVPLATSQGDLYGRTKALGEQAALEVASRTGLALTIVRPGMVYGPGSKTWTVGMLRLLQKGVPMLFGDGSGHAFPVFIDDLLAMLRLAATHPQAPGEAFNASGPSVTWAQFLGYYARMSGRSLRRLPMPVAKVLVQVNKLLHLGLPLTVERLQYVSRRLNFPTAKAERLLGWRQLVSLDAGMQHSEKWLRQSGYLQR